MSCSRGDLDGWFLAWRACHISIAMEGSAECCGRKGVPESQSGASKLKTINLLNMIHSLILRNYLLNGLA